MENVEVCRICLVMDVKMYEMHSFPLYTYFEPIIGVNPLSTLDLPPYVCFECATLLKKYYQFREKCMLGQSILYGILQSTGKITIEDLKLIDRQQLKLVSNLKNISILEEKVITISHNEEPQTVKEENETVTNDENFNAELQVPLVEYLKFETEFSDVPFVADTGAVSSDDEPLLIHKLNKEKKKEKKQGKKRKREKETGNELAEEDFTENELEHFEGEELGHFEATDSECLLASQVPQKRKRGRPKKLKEKVPKESRTKDVGLINDDFDLEEYCTVIVLTEKQQIEEIQARQQSSNFVNAPFQCKLCFKGFIEPNAWSHHLSKHDPKTGDVICEICKFRFKTRRALQKHAANHAKKYACKACPYVSKTITQAKQHQRWHKGVTYKCQYCDEISSKWTSYLSHVRMKHPSEFICGVCGYSFVSKLGLTMHKTMMHKDVVEKAKNTESGPYCEECDVKFISVEAFKRHMVTSVKHTQNKDFNTGCKVCGESFTTSVEMKLHHRREHARKRPKNYGKKPSQRTWPTNCDLCSTVIPNARSYWTHYRRAHPDKAYPIQKNYVCDVCGKSFRGNAFLVYHKRTHSTERAYKCDLCPKAFFNRANLQMHEKTHSDRRPYPCSVCCKAFKSKGSLDRHFRSHTGVKPYECDVCGKGFAQSNSRKLHMRTVHLKLPAPYVSRNRLEKKKQTVAQTPTETHYIVNYS